MLLKSILIGFLAKILQKLTKTKFKSFKSFKLNLSHLIKVNQPLPNFHRHPMDGSRCLLKGITLKHKCVL